MNRFQLWYQVKFYNKILGHSLLSVEIFIGCTATEFELNAIYKLYDT